MLAIQAKQGIESACQKVFQSSGGKFTSFQMMWHGDTAKVNFKSDGSAIIVLPALDETKDVSKKLFNDLIGYVLHELGHVWFTTNQPWDDAVKEHGKYIGTLINGLEDPRIERKVIESGYAPNSADLFNALINNVLAKNGYPDALTKQSLSFILCVEGRRLNGYAIDVPDLITGSPFAVHIKWALESAHDAPSTKRIADIAMELYDRLFDGEDESDKGEPDKGEPDEGESAKGNPSDDGKPSKGEGADDKDGKRTDGKSSGDSADGESMPDDGTEPLDPEVNDYITEESKTLKCGADARTYRPVLNSVQVVDFNFS